MEKKHYDCDSDDDGDGVADDSDNCPVVANAEQANLDSDSAGDACDPDDDDDAVPDVSDAYPLDVGESVDTDGDGVGNNADNCRSVQNANQQDANGNGVGDVCEEDDGFMILLPVIKKVLEEQGNPP